MRVILDTNVVVSGVFFGGLPGRILSAWSAGKLVLVLSPAILGNTGALVTSSGVYILKSAQHLSPS